MADEAAADAGLPPLRRGQCPGRKDGKRCARPAGHTGLCDPGPLPLSLDELYGEPWLTQQ